MKILAIANAGGHFIQLLRLAPAFEGHDIAYMTSIESFKDLVPGYKLYVIPDANRSRKWKLVTGFMKVFLIVVKHRPNVIISTGAALGLMGIIAGKCYGAKTIWVDSIANAGEISLSGRLAAKVATRCYTQWPDLTNTKFIYQGNVLS